MLHAPHAQYAKPWYKASESCQLYMFMLLCTGGQVERSFAKSAAAFAHCYQVCQLSSAPPADGQKHGVLCSY